MSLDPEPMPWAYLDANVLIDLKAVFNAKRIPDENDPNDGRLFAAARLYFYGYGTWYFVTSSEARAELARPHDWTGPFILDIDETPDAPSPDNVQALAAEYVTQGGLSIEDARHVARCILRPWVQFFITNDRDLARRAQALDLGHLTVLSTAEAVLRLGIAPAQQPRVGPVPGSLLASGPRWWIP